MPFQDLHDQICDALRGSKPRLVLEVFVPGAMPALVFEDGSAMAAPKGERANEQDPSDPHLK